MVGGDEVQDETQTLTNEDIKEIKEKVDEEEEEADALVLFLKKVVDTIVMEEFFETNMKMNLFRNVLAKGILKFAEEHTSDRPEMERFVDSFRVAWKVYKKDGDEKVTMDAFMKAMNNELWFNEEYPLRSEDTKA